LFADFVIDETFVIEMVVDHGGVGVAAGAGIATIIFRPGPLSIAST
jgi:hypothetical protein